MGREKSVQGIYFKLGYSGSPMTLNVSLEMYEKGGGKTVAVCSHHASLCGSTVKDCLN